MTEAIADVSPPVPERPEVSREVLIALLKNAAEGISFLGLSIHQRRMPSQSSWEGLAALLDAIQQVTE